MVGNAQGLSADAIAPRIASVRGQRVIVDADLAALYGVQTKRFNEAVKRNLARFPADFMFTLSAEEFAALRSQFATSNSDAGGRGGRRYAPRVFTEHGALMAATILNSARAVEVSIYVVRAFVRLRKLAAVHGDLAKRLDQLEAKTESLALSHDTTRAQLKQVFDALRALMAPPDPPDPPKRPIGFVTPPQSTQGRNSSTSLGASVPPHSARYSPRAHGPVKSR
jgi:ORF6N domain